MISICLRLESHRIPIFLLLKSMDQVPPHRYMVYGKEGVFDADRLIDLLRALEAELREEGGAGRV